MTLNDLTLLEFIVVGIHTVTAGSFLALAINIRQMRKYLRWNSHIYPVMMYGALLTSLSLIWLLTSNYFYDISVQISLMMISTFLGMMCMGYAVSAEAKRLAHKYDKLESKDKEIHHLEGIIDQLKKKKFLISLIVLFILLNCGGLKKEINRLTEESKVKTEQYEKRISELDSKISETENREATTKTQLQEKTQELSSLKKERDELKQTLDKIEKTDFSVKNPVGPVKVTDTKGNQYEFQGGAGTEINNTSESKLSTTLQTVKESLLQTQERLVELLKTVDIKESTIRAKNAEITKRDESITKFEASIKKLKENLEKKETITSTPVWVWVLAGMFLMIALQLAWKFGKGYLTTYLPFLKSKKS